MIIAVTSTGDSLQSTMDERFGRAPFFLLVDSETEQLVRVIANTEVNAAHGAGIASAQVICDSGAGVLLTGNLGPKAQQVFDSSNMTYVTGMCGTVLDAVRLFKSGRTSNDAGANSPGISTEPKTLFNKQRISGQVAGTGSGRGMGGGGGRGMGGGGGRGGGGRNR